ncbi:MAG: hypothetical protein KAQ83_01815 [Nanoarchaeota archaeon]|nr:hypothetical protein [Nanoarchaeota archaeon]
MNSIDDVFVQNVRKAMSNSELASKEKEIICRQNVLNLSKVINSGNFYLGWADIQSANNYLGQVLTRKDLTVKHKNTIRRCKHLLGRYTRIYSQNYYSLLKTS